MYMHSDTCIWCTGAITCINIAFECIMENVGKIMLKSDWSVNMEQFLIFHGIFQQCVMCTSNQCNYATDSCAHKHC